MINSVLVSIICPTFNSEKYIAETINSVKRQTMKNWELILVDDCSTDNTIEIVRPYLEDSKIILREFSQNSGPAEARNAAIKMARGRYIAFLDSDDTWSPEKLEIQLNFMIHNDCSFSYSEFYLINEVGANIGRSQTLAKKVEYDNLLRHCIIQTSTAMYDTAVHGKVFCPPLRRRQDFGLFLAALRKGATARLVTDIDGNALRLAGYRLHSASVSSIKRKNIPYQWAIYRDIEKLNFFRSLYLMMNWIYYSGVKNISRRLQLESNE